MEAQAYNPTGTAEEIIKATRKASEGNTELAKMGKEVVVDEDTSTVEDGEEVGVYFYVQVDENVYKVDISGAEFIGEAGKFPPKIKLESITNTTNSITVQVSTKRNEGGKIEYYIKADDEEEYTLNETTTDTSYTYTGLEQNKKYNIKVIAVAENKQTAEVLEDATLGSVTISEGNITSSVSWSGTTATVTFTTKTGYYIQTSTDGTTWSSNPSTAGTATVSVTTGTTVYARLTDSSGQYNSGDAAATTPILKYTISFNGNGATSGTMADLTSIAYGTSYTLTTNAYSRTGYKFTGWNTSANGTGTTYADKASVKNLTTTNGATVTLYAQWEVDVNADEISFTPSDSSWKVTDVQQALDDLLK